MESNISELKKLAQIFLQRFTSLWLQHILWSIYSFPDFSFIMEFSKFHGTLWDCWAWKKCQSSRWGAHVHPTESLSPGVPASLAFSQETHWQNERYIQHLKHYRYSNLRNGSYCSPFSFQIGLFYSHPFTHSYISLSSLELSSFDKK